MDSGFFPAPRRTPRRATTVQCTAGRRLTSFRLHYWALRH